jgi:LCP family protein required for cell wall assembly
MTDWPEGWVRGSGPSSSRSADEATRVIPTATETRSPRRAPGPTQPPPPRQRRRRAARGRGRWLRRTLLVLLLVLALLAGLGLYFYSRVAKVDALRDYPGRPAATPGQDWLLVGSDSREGLTAEQRKRLKTGSAQGRRTDTVMLLHVPSGGGAPTMVSLPRDSYVPIPGRGRNKLNAAYAFGGAPLLVRTVETVTGIRIDHYTEIGFGGFVGVVDALGGVQLCPTRNIKDKKSGLDVQAGCQEMAGPTALAYVRARYFDPKGDLGRVQRQQEFLSAIFAKASSPGVLINPFKLVSVGNAGASALTVDQRDGPIDLLRFALAMHAVAGKHGTKTTVPVANPNLSTPAGSAVQWDRARARALFNSLR